MSSFKKVNFGILLSCVILCACESNKKTTVTESGTEVVKVRTPTSDTINKEVVPENVVKSVEGKVTAINHGKDGYTATLLTSSNEIFAVTISHSNLKDPKQYRSVKIGDELKVTGDYWKMENDNQITVREIN